MYFGVMFFMVGQSLFFQSIGFLGFTFVWVLCLHVNVLVYEEPNLRRRFGDSYIRYTAAVNRWVPGRAYRETRPGAW
jgi:protein-S-isoprenylcysteine O-methyltransferase Ste14